MKKIRCEQAEEATLRNSKLSGANCNPLRPSSLKEN